MKKLLTSILLTITLITNSQKLTTDKLIVMGIGSSVTTYGFLRNDKTPAQHRESIMICSSGLIFTGLYLSLKDKLPVNIEVNSSGVNIKLKYKRFKCFKYPYR